MALKNESGGIFEEQGYSVRYTGIGLISAARVCTEEIILNKPDAIFNFGTAGSIKFSVGEIIEINQFCLRGDVLATVNSFIKSQSLTDDKKGFCGSADFLEVANAANQYDVYDMEAYAIARVCKDYAIPFHCFKLITDQSNTQLKQDWKKNLEVYRHHWVDLIKTLNNS